MRASCTGAAPVCGCTCACIGVREVGRNMHTLTLDDERCTCGGTVHWGPIEPFRRCCTHALASAVHGRAANMQQCNSTSAEPNSPRPSIWAPSVRTMTTLRGTPTSRRGPSSASHPARTISAHSRAQWLNQRACSRRRRPASHTRWRARALDRRWCAGERKGLALMHVACCTIAFCMLRAAGCMLYSCMLYAACCTIAVCMLRAALCDTCCMLHVACCSVACCVLHAVCCTVACCMLHVACCVLHSVCCVTHVACCMSDAACCETAASSGCRRKCSGTHSTHRVLTGLQVEKKVKRSDRGPFMREWDFCDFVRQYRTLEWKDK